jgi:alpha-amylase/alpha-mannosidase (GH57 family)
MLGLRFGELGETDLSDSLPRYLCIHGHFYQPPRDNPWLEAVEVQDSAAPYHDWNERITRECYAPNARARIVDGQGKIINLLNNYAWISYNFGPTLLAWLAEAAPGVLAGIVEGDRVSLERRHGHGNALAQVYNHIIMPLASQADKRTQVSWGIADFRFRFGRDPEGMWLAETAADVASLECLAEAGIRFTILAPHQARRWRRIGDTEWLEGPGEIDPTRAYLCRLPSGKSIDLFFYDGSISRAVAFEKLLDSGEKFLARLLQGFDASRKHPQIVHIATDGESYGHHHHYGDMALAFVLDRLSKDSSIRLTNYGEFLELHPPEWEVEIRDNTSWSCMHGVERWRSNCGCNMGRGWQQEWRGPLRQAMDHLKSRLDRTFSTRGRECFPDPWAAHAGYINVILDRSSESVRAFLASFAHPDLDDLLIRNALWLLEMQRNALLMFASCGWFFDEISGLETTQCLRYAGRAIQLARHFQLDFEQEFVEMLEKAPSNLPEFKNGRGVWEQLIRPAGIELDRVLAHYAIGLIYREPKEHDSVYCYDLRTLDQEVQSRGNTHLAMGRLHVRSRLTWNQAETSVLVIHYGGLDFHAVLRRAPALQEYDAFKLKLFNTYQTESMADVSALATTECPGVIYRLGDLFVEERRRIIGIVLQDRFADYQQSFDRLADADEDVIYLLGRLRYPITKAMRAAATVSFDHRILQEIVRLENGEGLKRIKHLVERGKVWGYQQDSEVLGRAIASELKTVLREVNPLSDLTRLTTHAGHLLDAANLLGISMDLWEAQNLLLDGFAHTQATGGLSPALHQALGHLAAQLKMSQDLLGWHP